MEIQLSADLAEMFDEAVAQDEDSEVTAIVEPVVENPDAGADSDETPEDDLADDTDNTDEVPEASVVAETFDWTEHSDQNVTVKVQGKDVTMTLRQAMDNGMMREDYSQKTAALAADAKLVDWAKDVQDSFNRDPEGTLEAFRQAFGIQNSPSVVQEPVADPYEDLDPETAQIMRAFDQKLASVTDHYENEIQGLRAESGQRTHERLVQEAQNEMAGLKSQFSDAGYKMDELEVLQIATADNVSLSTAASVWAGRNLIAGGKTASTVAQIAADAASGRKSDDDASRLAAKKSASSTVTKRYAAGEVSVDDFDTISDLFEIEMNRSS